METFNNYIHYTMTSRNLRLLYFLNIPMLSLSINYYVYVFDSERGFNAII